MPNDRQRADHEAQEPERADPKPAPAPESRPQVARRLASQIGNAAFARHVQRRTLSRVPLADTAAAVADVPTGPLVNLRDELDDFNVDEDECLKLIGQLGEGERTLVRRDNTMLRQMADAFNLDEMFQAVELLKMDIKWQLYWLDEAGSIDDLGGARWARLLNAATPDQFGELVGYEWAREAARSNYDGDPLQLRAPQAEPARVLRWLEQPGFAGWVLARTGATNLAIWMAANTPVTAIAALKTATKFGDLLTALRRGGPAGEVREALHLLFTASTDAADRRALYEIRFGRRAEGAFDWIADGEAEWVRQESFAGGGQTTAAIEAAIAAGGPATAEAAATASPEGPLAELRKELDSFNVDEDGALRLLAQLTDSELYLVGRDATMLENMASAFNGGEMTRALNLLRFMPLKNALKFISDAGEAEDVPAATYQTIVNRATPQECAEAIGWQLTCDVLSQSSHVDPLSMPLRTDNAMVAHVITSYAQFTEWAINMRESDEGGASSYLRFLAAHSPATTYKALFDAGRSSSLLDALPTGAQLSPTDQAAMKTIFKAVAEVPIKVELMQKRFNLERIGEDTGQPGGGQFEGSTLDHMWDLFERVPPRDLADSDFLEQITRLPNTAAASGVTGSHRVGLGYDPTKMADVEGPAPGTGPGPGAYTDAGDQMQGMNVFDTTLLHELGHVSDREHEWTRDGGPFDTNPDLGAWQNHGTDTDDLVDLWCGDATLNLSATVTATEMPHVKEAYQHALDNHLTNVQAAFQALCTAGGGPAWGTAGDTWQPLWAKVSAHAVTRIVGMAQNKTQQPWQTPPPAAGGRIYHDTGYSWLNWVSYKADTRVGKLSWYAFRAKNDFFAEMFATYYATTPPGTAVNAWKPAIYEWFRQNVDAGYHTEATP